MTENRVTQKVQGALPGALPGALSSTLPMFARLHHRVTPEGQPPNSSSQANP
jgi:hypothetical protein